MDEVGADPRGQTATGRGGPSGAAVRPTLVNLTRRGAGFEDSAALRAVRRTRTQPSRPRGPRGLWVLSHAQRAGNVVERRFTARGPRCGAAWLRRETLDPLLIYLQQQEKQPLHVMNVKLDSFSVISFHFGARRGGGSR